MAYHWTQFDIPVTEQEIELEMTEDRVVEALRRSIRSERSRTGTIAVTDKDITASRKICACFKERWSWLFISGCSQITLNVTQKFNHNIQQVPVTCHQFCSSLFICQIIEFFLSCWYNFLLSCLCHTFLRELHFYLSRCNSGFAKRLLTGAVQIILNPTANLQTVCTSSNAWLIFYMQRGDLHRSVNKPMHIEAWEEKAENQF